MTFYAAGCEKFHSMQTCYTGLTITEAVEKYKEICQDPRLAYYGNAMGVEVHDEALEVIRESFPEYRFVAPEEIKERFYMEHMTTDELVGALLDLAKESDAYEFMEQVDSLEDTLMEIKYNLLEGNGMKEYTSELTDEIQPMVKIQFSQDLEFKEGSMIPLAEANEKFRAADENGCRHRIYW